jgi:hypothetical protein
LRTTLFAACLDYEAAQTAKTASAVSLARHARRELDLHVPISVSGGEFCVAQNEYFFALAMNPKKKI